MPLTVAPPTNPGTISSVGVAQPTGNITTQDPNKVVTTLNGINYNYAGDPVKAPTASNSGQDAYAASIQALINAANGGAGAKVYAPALDTNAIYNKAQTTANANVNPYYTKLLNDFVSNQAQARTLQEQQMQFNVKGLQDELARITGANDVTGQRATADTADAENQINQNADYRQTDQGMTFDNARINEATGLAQSGLTGSGLGAKQQLTTDQNFNTKETRQGAQDEHSIMSAELAKARTFEDIATSNTNAASGEKRGEQQANFDLNKFIVNQTQDLQQQQQQLEAQRQQAVAAEKKNQISLQVNAFINSIANPAKKQAALQTYGAYL